MSRFRKEFLLKQHTPIIHFQSDQSGATLRATELKPKFDRFLIEIFEKEQIDYKDFLILGQERALDYKVKIEPNMSLSTTIDGRSPLFFGNMGDGKDKEFKENKESFKISFSSFNIKLKEYIEQYFEAFLANTNFGTRQSKGFGSFYIDGKSFDKNLVKHKVYSFSSSKGHWDRDIKLFYSFLRQGINLPNRNGTRFYAKPAIFLYAKERGWEWDKKAIKEHFFPSDLVTQQKKYSDNSPINYSSNNKKLLRDLFGLSTEQLWMSYSATVKQEHDDIERFKSPITFKVVENMVYFWADNSYKDILGEEFKIITKGNSPLTLSTPTDFDFNDFFKFIKTINLSQVVESKYQSENEYRTLNKILQNLKVQR